MSKLNENRPGYKKTKVGWIPEEWECVLFGELVCKSQYGLSQSTSEDGNVSIIGMSNLQEGKIIFEEMQQIEISNNEFEKYCIKKNDLLFNRTNSRALVGKTALAMVDMECVFASYLVRFSLNGTSIYPLFVAYYFNEHNAIARLKALATPGVSQYNINPTTLQKHFYLPIPHFSEQKKIAEILSHWDRAIEITNRLITNYELLKKGLMQQLLTGKRRFKEFKQDEWGKMKLHDFLKPVSRPLPRPDKEYTALGIRSHGKGTFLRTVDNPEDVMMDTLYEVKENDLIVNITFAWEGAIAIVKKSDEGALVSHRFPIHLFKKDKVIPEYFRHLILTKRFVHQLKLISPGGAGRNRVMSKKDFLNLTVNIPPLPEQQKIAAVLNGMDKEISFLEDQLTALQEQKKGLMQKLLTGNIRVKTD